MEFDYTEQERAWISEIRQFLQAEVTPEYRQEMESGTGDRKNRQRVEAAIAARGWNGVTWPREYGGLGLSSRFQHIFAREFSIAGGPTLNLAINSIGPMIMRYGTEQNKAEFLPPIARGELTVAVGYSEPNAGTDLASLKTRAVLDGDEWVINGSKIWNSFAKEASHEWLCVRTDPDAAKHRGLSVIIVPTSSPGIEIYPLPVWNGAVTYQTFFTDVRVPKSNLIGSVNCGWEYMTGALDLERGAISNAGVMRRLMNELLLWASKSAETGTCPISDPVIQRELALLDADIEAAELMGWEHASELDSGTRHSVSATVEKVFSTEVMQNIGDTGTRIFGMDGITEEDDDHAINSARFWGAYRFAPINRFGGGTNDVLRDIIAQRGYGLPRSR